VPIGKIIQVSKTIDYPAQSLATMEITSLARRKLAQAEDSLNPQQKQKKYLDS
jgi:hypothetical protein